MYDFRVGRVDEGPESRSASLSAQEDAQIQEERMDQGPLTLDSLNRSAESGEEFLSLLRTLLAESESGTSLLCDTSGVPCKFWGAWVER